MESKKPLMKSPFLIMGLGLSGKSALRLLRHAGVAEADILTYDSKNSSAQISDLEGLKKLKAQTVIVSPGISLSSPEVRYFKEKGLSLTSEMELAMGRLATEKIIGVTGSVGKSTVIGILSEGLKAIDPSAFAGGNFGVPLADYVVDVESGRRARAKWLALELSSYQLENFPTLRCDATLITSLTPNHLDRYASLEDYYQTKLKLLQHCSGPRILNRSGQDLWDFMKSHDQKDLIWTDRKDPEIAGVLNAPTPLLGLHNQDNLALCLRLSKVMNWPADFARRALSFSGLPHRLQNLGEKRGVLFINDSKATTLSSVLQAATSLRDVISHRKACYWLIGGQDKNLPWEELSQLKDLSPVRWVFFGESGAKAKKRSGLSGLEFATLKDALGDLFSKVQAGETVVLSPGGASFDEFRSFEDRGRFFIDEIERWSSVPDPRA